LSGLSSATTTSTKSAAPAASRRVKLKFRLLTGG
jgi:hypothetical protein